MSKYEPIQGIFSNVWLTAVQDSKWCFRLDNFLGHNQMAKMKFWMYDSDDIADVKTKTWTEKPVAMAD